MSGGTKTLYTERLMLRKFVVEDAQEMFDSYANDADVSRFLNWEPHGDIEVTRNPLKEWVDEYKKDNCFNWAIIYDGELIGAISLLNPDDERCEAEAGYCMAKRFWGRGIMAEALHEVIRYAFDEAGFIRIFAKHNVDNPNSGRVMKKCNMKYIETKMAPYALDTDRMELCDCYEIIKE